MSRARHALAAVALAAGALQVHGQVVSLEYEGLLRQYARGETAAAVSALGRIRPGDLDDQVRAIQRRAKDAARCATCADPLDDLPLRAAVMLHADRDEAERPAATGSEHARACPGVHARRAGQLAAVLATRGVGDRDFARRFFLAMAERCQWDFCLEAATQWARDGLERFPGDAPLLVTLGAALEEWATVFQPQSQRERGERFREAAKVLQEAIVADPARDDARVHLGRVQWRLGDDAAARATLEEMLARRPDAPLEFLAQLFLGQVHERAGRTPDAAAAFARALELDPQSQAAAIALSHAALVTGDVGRSRALVEQALALAGRREMRDLYWDYVASNAASAEARFDGLRREARQ